MNPASPTSAIARARQSAISAWMASRTSEKVSSMARQFADLLARAASQPWDCPDQKAKAIKAGQRAARKWEESALANVHMGVLVSVRAYLERAAQGERLYGQGRALEELLSVFEAENAEAGDELGEKLPPPLGAPIPFVADETPQRYYVENMDEIPSQMGVWRLSYVHDHSTHRTTAVSRCVTCRHERSCSLSDYLRRETECPSCRRRKRNALTTSVRPGDVFGSLTAVTMIRMKGEGGRWRCRCACGGEAALTGAALLSGKYAECRVCRTAATVTRED